MNTTFSTLSSSTLSTAQDDTAVRAESYAPDEKLLVMLLRSKSAMVHGRAIAAMCAHNEGLFDLNALTADQFLGILSGEYKIPVAS